MKPMKLPPLERLHLWLERTLDEPAEDVIRELDPMTRGYLEQMRQRRRRAGEPDDLESVLRSAVGDFEDFVNDLAARHAKTARRSRVVQGRPRLR